jgi:ATP-dependent RNA helicase DeaD
VLDEADEMLEIGFIDDVEKIMTYTPEERQTLLFSATFPDQLLRLARKHTNNPAEVATASGVKTVDNIQQEYITLDDSDRPLALIRLIEQSDEDDVFLVFCERRTEVERLMRRLERLPFSVKALHGGYDQASRFRVMSAFREKEVKVLVATDVASRGLDVKHVTRVVNYSVPRSITDYTHRIGRTGRAGRQGHAVTLVDHEHMHRWRQLLREATWEIERVDPPGRGRSGRDGGRDERRGRRGRDEDRGRRGRDERDEDRGRDRREEREEAPRGGRRDDRPRRREEEREEAPRSRDEAPRGGRRGERPRRRDDERDEAPRSRRDERDEAPRGGRSRRLDEERDEAPRSRRDERAPREEERPRVERTARGGSLDPVTLPAGRAVRRRDPGDPPRRARLSPEVKARLDETGRDTGSRGGRRREEPERGEREGRRESRGGSRPRRSREDREGDRQEEPREERSRRRDEDAPREGRSRGRQEGRDGDRPRRREREPREERPSRSASESRNRREDRGEGDPVRTPREPERRTPAPPSDAGGFGAGL